MPARVASKKTASPPAELPAQRRRRARRIIAHLQERYPQVRLPLVHRDPFQLLVATILSAQCTDARVNKVTPELFQNHPTPQDLAALDQKVLEQEIRSTGFFRNKAKNIIGAARAIVSDFAGE